MNKKAIENLLYAESDEDAKAWVAACRDPEALYVFAFNYNLDDGFEIPDSILSNPLCTISTARLLFFRADGAAYLCSKAFDADLPEWSTFIAKLYERLIAQEFQPDTFQFVVPLGKVQKFKLKKELGAKELFLLEDSAGIDLDIEV